MVLAGVGVGISFLKPSLFESLEKKLYDFHFVLRGPLPPSEDIVLLTVDERALEALGRWPWSRDIIADLFQKLVDGGARIVIPDIFFPDPSSGQKAAENDKKFAETLHNHPNILMGFILMMTSQEVQNNSMPAQKTLENLKNVSNSFLHLKKNFPKMRTALGLEDALPIFSQLPGRYRQGFFNILADPDGTVRQTPLILEFQKNILPSLTLQSLFAVKKIKNSETFVEELPLDVQGDFLIHFHTADYKRLSVADFYQGNTPPSVQNKIVIVGASAAGLMDTSPTPLSLAMPSEALMANILDNLITGDFLQRTFLTETLSRVLILLTGILLGLLIPQCKPGLGILLFISVEALQWFIIHLLFIKNLWVLQTIYPLFSGFLVYGGTSLYGYLLQDKEKRFINKTFEYYLSPDVIRELTENPDKLRLGGEKKELTVFFSDIRDFSSIVETTPPDILVEFLNSYLTPATDIIFENKGLLDKYIGDAIMAVFGAPLPEPQHARHACEAAVKTIQFLAANQAKWQKEFSVPPLKIGIGINTGFMTVGNMGSKRRFDYTVMGDAVNLASRLEGLNKFYKTRILVAQNTYAQTKEHFFYREIDEVQVKGKKECVRIYELIVDPVFDPQVLLPLFAEALAHYRQGAFEKAQGLFEKCLDLCPTDGPSQIFMERCMKMALNPPSEWKGVTTFFEK